MTKKPETIIKEFRTALRAMHDPERAIQEKRYLKSPYKFFGVRVPELRRLAKEFSRSHRDASRQSVLDLADALWASPYHQEKSLAIMVLQYNPQHLDIEAVPFIERIMSECNGWDHADWISINLMGAVLQKDLTASRVLSKWAASWSLWLRRASLTAQIPLLRKGAGERELFFRLARGMIDEKEFFIRKAIGWCVREISKADPIAARDFLLPVRDRASGLTLREGAKRLPLEMKQEVLGK